MTLSRVCAATLAAIAISLPSAAQDALGNVPQARERDLLLKFATFDPTMQQPVLPDMLAGGTDIGLWIVQYDGRPDDDRRAQLVALGGEIISYLPHNAYVVRFPRRAADRAREAFGVRYVGQYLPAFRIDPSLFGRLGGAKPSRYNVVVTDKRRDKPALAAGIEAIGGRIVDIGEGSILLIADLTGTQLAAAARLDQVLWIDAWSPPELDMDNARIQGGGNYVESVAGYNGTGIRGHVYEGVEFNHPDFNTPLTNVASGGAADSHGHCTAGIVFGNGNSNPAGRGMAPNAVGFYTNYSTPVGTRNAIIGQVVNTHQCMFTTASWGDARTTQYTAVSADADDIIFDHRIPWTQSQSNAGDPMSRPQAWAKNIFSIGAVQHFNNSNAADDSWNAGNASTGPAADGRIKPDLCAYYDSVGCSDRTGAAGYAAGSFTGTFGGTSAATPIVAGHNALAIQMYTDFIFGNTPTVAGGTRFQNRPLAQTLKTIMIASAQQYTFTGASTDNRREHQGWGFPSLQRLYDTRTRMFIVPENRTLLQGATDSFTIAVASGQPELKVSMSFLDPAGNPAASLARINDLTLRVTSPAGVVYWGNNGLSAGNYSTAGGSANTIDTVENVFVQNPQAGNWTVDVIATLIAQDAHVATGAVDATYALTVFGGVQNSAPVACARFVPDSNPAAGSCNVIPFGIAANASLPTLFATNNGGSTGGCVYFNVNVTNLVTIEAIDVNTSVTAGTAISMEVYLTAPGGTHVGNENNAAAWNSVGLASGTAGGSNLRSNLRLAQPLTLRPGTYGMALRAVNFNHSYTNGTGTNQSYSNADIAVQLGSATNTPFSGGVFTPRVANIEFDHAPPATTTWRNQRYQTILRATQLGGSGTISSISFAPCGSGTHASESLRITMSHVPANWTLSSTFASNLPSPVTVLNMTPHAFRHTQDQWGTVALQTPFAYNGTSDVVVEVISTGNRLFDESGPAGFRTGAVSRVFAAGWTGTPPTTGSVNSTAALKMRVEFGCANLQVYGTGCGGLNLAASGAPVLGGSYTVSASGGLPNSPIWLYTGPLSSGVPFDYHPFGYTNCFLWLSAMTASSTTTDTAGNANVVVPVPNSTALIGALSSAQFLQSNTSVAGDFSFSNALRVVTGIAP